MPAFPSVPKRWQAERNAPRRLAFAEAVDRKPAFPEPLRQPGEIAVGADQHEPIEPLAIHQVHRIHRERDVCRVLALDMGRLVARHDGEGADRGVP